jgi:hypothetical protein
LNSDRVTQQLERHAKQSEVRVRSGLKLVAILLALAIVLGSLKSWGAVKVVLATAAFFGLATSVEHWNVVRRRRQVSALKTEHNSK